jgi:hypothetical protein
MYAGGEYLTGDDIAVALLEYGESLAEAGAAAMVEIPVIADHGHRVHATFLIGPASQIVATDVEAEGDELVDDIVVEELRLLTRRLRPVAFPVDEGAPYADEYD